MTQPGFGIYESLIDEHLRGALQRYPELRPVFGKIDKEEQPSIYAAFVARVLEEALREASPESRLALCNEILTRISSHKDLAHFVSRHLVTSERLPERDKALLLEIKPPHYYEGRLPRPETPMARSSLFTGAPHEPRLAEELNREMCSADGVDILVSFIKWSGLRLLMPGLEELLSRDVKVRVLTTSYMGASDATAIEWLARQPNVSLRVSYDTERTRLHAKAWHFRRDNGYSTAYIGSSNMSHAAMTSGLEWNLKVTAQDLGPILDKFIVEFETCWNSREFIPFDPSEPRALREAIEQARHGGNQARGIFFDLRPYHFQERILEALERERVVHDQWRNLVVAATGTGKTVVAAFDFSRFYQERGRQARLLFIAHRQEILRQARETFRQVLRDQNFGDLLVGDYQPERLDHLFCSVQSLSSRRLWEQTGSSFYDFIILDEAHHSAATTYRPLFDNYQPRIMLGMTATPERMDGDSILPDFGNRLAAEIRLPEALDQKLLCPFHYFGISDPIPLNDDRFWRNGRYDISALDNVYVLDRKNGERRVEAIIDAINKYEPAWDGLKGLGFCVSIRHAEFMAEQFKLRGIAAEALVSGRSDRRDELLKDLGTGRLRFLFTVDMLNEGLDIPEVNIVLFLRPTESLTVFLQQLGRGLRHAPGKDCLTVLDFVGQAHRRYRADIKYRALLPRHRHSIDREVEERFPHLPAGCSIQLDRLARKYVLDNIRENFKNLKNQIPERISTFTSETGQPLTFANFIRFNDYPPEKILNSSTWSEWKATSRLVPVPTDPDLASLRGSLLRATAINGPAEIRRLRAVVRELTGDNITGAIEAAGNAQIPLHYRFWGENGLPEANSIATSLQQVARNRSFINDLSEVLDWAEDSTRIAGLIPQLPFGCELELHARYGNVDIQSYLGKTSFTLHAQRGVGVIHIPELKAYALLITFQKTEREFSPSTMYADYPISRDHLHWESQANTARDHAGGRNLIDHRNRGYTVLIFARATKKESGITTPFTYLGPADKVSDEGERPIKFVWKLRYPMPVEMFEDNRRGG